MYSLCSPIQYCLWKVSQEATKIHGSSYMYNACMRMCTCTNTQCWICQVLNTCFIRYSQWPRELVHLPKRILSRERPKEMLYMKEPSNILISFSHWDVILNLWPSVLVKTSIDKVYSLIPGDIINWKVILSYLEGILKSFIPSNSGISYLGTYLKEIQRNNIWEKMFLMHYERKINERNLTIEKRD